MAIHPDKTAYRAVDACGGTYTPEQYASGFAVGHAAALDAALEAVKKPDALMADLLAALKDAQAIIDDVRCDLHQRRVADWHPEAANNAALQMSEDMRLIGNRLADVDFSAAIAKASTQ